MRYKDTNGKTVRVRLKMSEFERRIKKQKRDEKKRREEESRRQSNTAFQRLLDEGIFTYTKGD